MGETTTAANKAPVFGKGSGQLLLPVGTASDIAYSAFLQPDGKIVMAGRSWNGSDGDFSLVRLNPDGSLDSSFAAGGKLLLPVGTRDDLATIAFLLPDGKIVVAGYSHNGSNNDFSVVRLNSDGSLDTSFDSDGKRLLPVGAGDDEVRSAFPQPDGRIVVAGHSLNGSNVDFGLVLLKPDGSLDTRFDGDGKLLLPVGTNADLARSAFVQPDGKIVVAGVSDNGPNADFSLVRLNPDGSLDTSFDGDGRLLLPVGMSQGIAMSAFLQVDGKIVVAGYSSIRGRDAHC